MPVFSICQLMQLPYGLAQSLELLLYRLQGVVVFWQCCWVVFLLTCLQRYWVGRVLLGAPYILTAAYVAPISIIVGIVGMVPAVAFLFIPLGVYVFRLQVAVIQAAHRLTGMRSSVVVLIPTLLLFLLAYVFSLVANFISTIG